MSTCVPLLCGHARRLAEEAIQREWGCKPLYVREGGTMPVAAACERILNVSAPVSASLT